MTLRELAKAATQIENGGPIPPDLPEGEGLIVGITGPPGAGKSSLADALTAEFRRRGKTVAIIAVDPTSRQTHGAILGDRVRMQRHHDDPGVFIRSMATRGATGGLARTSSSLARLFRGAGYDFIIIETVGVGQDEIEIASLADVTLVVLVPGMGDDIQAIKAGIMEIADIFVINKSDHAGAEQTEREVLAQESLDTRRAPRPVLRTVATDATGIPQLADELQTRQKRAREARATWRIDHLGIAVRSIDEALPFYADQIGLPVLARETVEHEKVKVAMLPAGDDSRIELLEPLNADSTIAKYIEKRGPGLHHVAMRVPNLTATVERLKAAGVKLLNEPRAGAGGHIYVFIHPSSTGGVLWELIQE
ncbi:MAG TPA: methylmalonyl Co-A mutase-associated GTPase MeaB [Bryobacteraceae bacterium]|nr:methylmalonyl Co-A mutase-associated GTPase MeaB [Bryobacteraceae bacterium]